MKPPKREATDFEKVTTDDFVNATIEEVKVDEAHSFTFEGSTKIKPAVRLKFVVDGYKYPHYSRWMTFNYGEKSTLFIKYLSTLIEGAYPDMDMDVEVLKDMRVKMLWSEKNGFQSVDSIRPVNGKLFVPGVSDRMATAGAAASRPEPKETAKAPAKKKGGFADRDHDDEVPF